MLRGDVHCAVGTSNKPDIVCLTRGPRSELGRV